MSADGTTLGPVVIKIGGSLLDWPGLAPRLSEFLATRRAGGESLVVLAGGGPAADVVRAIDRTFTLGDVAAHRLALRSLDLTAHALAAIVPGLEVADELARLGPVRASGRIPVLAPRRFLDEVDSRSGSPLPPSWDVTSDSIAARLAVHLGAVELVLIKSTAIPTGLDRHEAARLGIVDPVFPAASTPLDRVVAVNLRSTPCEAVTLGRRESGGQAAVAP
jgi:aspartokinase-like uncharacterized kinase